MKAPVPFESSDALFNDITSQAVAFPSLQSDLAKAVKNGIANAGFDYYLLRARLFSAGYWDTEGFQLIQAGNKGVKIGATGNIEEIEEPETTYV
jgi:hypothetical protein